MHPHYQIYKGSNVDILNDGSLYPCFEGIPDIPHNSDVYQAKQTHLYVMFIGQSMKEW